MADANPDAFPQLSDAELAALEPLGVRRPIVAGEYLYRQGAPTYDFYVVLSGAVDGLLSNGFKQPVARIAASEAEHLSVVTRFSGGNPVGISFPDALTIDEASNALDAYTS